MTAAIRSSPAPVSTQSRTVAGLLLAAVAGLALFPFTSDEF